MNNLIILSSFLFLASCKNPSPGAKNLELKSLDSSKTLQFDTGQIIERVNLQDCRISDELKNIYASSLHFSKNTVCNGVVNMVIDNNKLLSMELVFIKVSSLEGDFNYFTGQHVDNVEKLKVEEIKTMLTQKSRNLKIECKSKQRLRVPVRIFFNAASR